MSDSPGGRLSEDRCLRQVAEPMLRAISGLHAINIVHRHIKPEHIVCGPRGIEGKPLSILVDFTDAALAKKHCLNSRVGETQYMAPEVRTGTLCHFRSEG